MQVFMSLKAILCTCILRMLTSSLHIKFINSVFSSHLSSLSLSSFASSFFSSFFSLKILFHGVLGSVLYACCFSYTQISHTITFTPVTSGFLHIEQRKLWDPNLTLIAILPSEQLLPLHPAGHSQMFGAVHKWLLSQLSQIADRKRVFKTIIGKHYISVGST